MALRSIKQITFNKTAILEAIVLRTAKFTLTTFF